MADQIYDAAKKRKAKAVRVTHTHTHNGRHRHRSRQTQTEVTQASRHKQRRRRHTVTSLNTDRHSSPTPPQMLDSTASLGVTMYGLFPGTINSAVKKEMKAIAPAPEEGGRVEKGDKEKDKERVKP